MKNLIFLLLLLAGTISSAQSNVRFSELPLNTAPNTIVPNDSFPYVQNAGPVMKRMKINDLLGIPVFVNKFALYAPIANPTFTGTVSGITKSMVGLGNVDNTSDLNKPISTATQAALDTKANSSDLTDKANTNLSNLESPVLVPTEILPQFDNVQLLGSGSNRWSSIFGDFISASSSFGLRDPITSDPIFTSAVIPNLFGLYSGPYLQSPTTYTFGTYDTYGFRGRNLGSNTHTLLLSTGNSTTGGQTGDIVHRIGTTSGTRGKIRFVDQSIGTIGHVWTSTDGNGAGAWQAAPSSGEVNTASNLGLGSVLFKQKVGVDLQFRSLVAGSGITLTQNADDITIAASGGSGANTALSNLSGVAINTDLYFADSGVGPSTRIISTGQASAPADLNASDHLLIQSGPSSFGSTGSLYFKTSNATNNAWGFGTVTSGGIEFETGTASNGPRGKIKFKDGTQGTVGHVWTQSAADGTGSWQAPTGGGGSGLDYVEVATPIADTNVTTANTWTDVTNAVVVVTPTGANEKWEIKFEGSLYVESTDGSNIVAGVRIVDSANNMIDNALMFVAQRAYTGGSVMGMPVTISARDTISSAKTYKVQIRKGSSGAAVGIYTGNLTGDLTGDDSKAKFFAAKYSSGSSGSALTVQDEGSSLSVEATKINFVGAGVTVTEPVADEITVTIPGASGSGWTSLIKTSANNGETLSNNDEVFADTTSAAFQLNLPATPTIGMRVRFVDKKGTWTTNNLTVGRNGSNIQGAAANFALNVDNGAVEFVYSDSTDGWLLITY